MIKYHDIYARGEAFASDYPDYYGNAVKQVKSDDLCGIIYTSGTKGAHKGVMLSRDNILSNAKAVRSILKFDETDSLLSFLPRYHSFERMAGQFTQLPRQRQLHMPKVWKPLPRI